MLSCLSEEGKIEPLKSYQQMNTKPGMKHPEQLTGGDGQEEREKEELSGNQ